MEGRSVLVSVFFLLTATDLLQLRQVQASRCIVYEKGFKLKVNVRSFHLYLAALDNTDPKVTVTHRGKDHNVILEDIRKGRWTFGQLCLNEDPKFYTKTSINQCPVVPDTISEVNIVDAMVCLIEYGLVDMALYELHGQGRENQVYVPHIEERQWVEEEEGKEEVLGVYNTHSTYIKLSVEGNKLQMCMAKDMMTTNMEEEEVVDEEEEKYGDDAVKGGEEVVKGIDVKEEEGLVKGMEEDVVVKKEVGEEKEMTKLMILKEVDDTDTSSCDPIPPNEFITINIKYKGDLIEITANNTFTMELDNKDKEPKDILFYRPEKEASLTIVQYFDTDSTDRYRPNTVGHSPDHHPFSHDNPPHMGETSDNEDINLVSLILAVVFTMTSIILVLVHLAHKYRNQRAKVDLITHTQPLTPHTNPESTYGCTGEENHNHEHNHYKLDNNTRVEVVNDLYGTRDELYSP
ncbi:hypothetical protein Pmani_013879 [Petrolisthes manimaculis]|uniref:Uncharacterized protein n=1 Tax=Petrolisthes manimaculis TaxID=1843537 RepID=A0AAE1PWM5_9EUCA|nr:hypothetical protein Pmani_013879 [Petrolisthes manimaculis]